VVVGMDRSGGKDHRRPARSSNASSGAPISRSRTRTGAGMPSSHCLNRADGGGPAGGRLAERQVRREGDACPLRLRASNSTGHCWLARAIVNPPVCDWH
jgi:hypothetical protein